MLKIFLKFGLVILSVVMVFVSYGGAPPTGLIWALGASFWFTNATSDLHSFQVRSDN